MINFFIVVVSDDEGADLRSCSQDWCSAIDGVKEFVKDLATRPSSNDSSPTNEPTCCSTGNYDNRVSTYTCQHCTTGQFCIDETNLSSVFCRF